MNAALLATRWRLLLTPPLDGATNMAVDVALMQHSRVTGEAVFRVYSWAGPTVSFGRNQAARAFYSAERMADAGTGVVRRPTGGRAILHHREITYSVTAPALDAIPLRAAYGFINDILLDAIKALGVGVTLAPRRGRAARPTAAPCFDEPSEGEMMAEGRKLVGSAQWREDGALLQHGSILVEDDQGLLQDFMTSPSRMSARPATLHSLLGHSPSTLDVAESIFSVVRHRADGAALELHSESVVALSAPFRTAFVDPAWTWRR